MCPPIVTELLDVSMVSVCVFMRKDNPGLSYKCVQELTWFFTVILCTGFSSDNMHCVVWQLKEEEEEDFIWFYADFNKVKMLVCTGNLSDTTAVM